MIEYLFSRLGGAYGDVTVLEDSFGNSFSGGALMRAIRRSAAFWKGYFGPEEHHVGILADNSAWWFIQAMGIIASGNVAAAVNPNLSNEDIADYIRRSDTEVLLCDEGMEEDLGRLGGDAELKGRIPVFSVKQAIGKGEIASVKREPEETVLLLPSSGTGGRSKIVELSDKNMSVRGYASGEGYGFRKEVLTPLPLYHVGGFTAVYRKLIQGYQVTVSSPAAMWRDIGNKMDLAVIMVPQMLQYLLQHPELLTDENGSRRVSEVYCAGSMVLPGIWEAMQRCRIRLYVPYGMTETAGSVSGEYGGSREGASGFVYPFNEVRTENGEILVRGDNVMKGYYKNPADTEEILKDGWLHTGDVGKIIDGYVYVFGRMKNIIILSNGENVSPEELESRLCRCPFITECRVYGQEDMLCAEIYTKGEEDDFADREQGIRRWVHQMNRELPMTHRIQRLDIRDTELEKTSMGKIRRA